MKKNTKTNIIGEKHSNVALVSSTLSLVALTLITFVYNVYFHSIPAKIIMAYNFMFVASIISWIVGATLVYFTNKKDIFCFEYSLFFLALSVCFFMLHGVSFPTIKMSIWITIAFIVVYWIATIIVHCFILPSKLFSKKTATIILTSIAALSLAIMIVYIVIASKIPGFSLWM